MNLCELMPLNEIVRMIPKRNNIPVHVSTLHRWRSKGIGGVKLEAQKIGGVYYTTKHDLDVFLVNINQKPPTQVGKNYEAAVELELRKLGF